MRAIDSTQEHAANKIARDTRPLGTRVAEFLSKPQTLIVLSGAGASIGFIFPMAIDLVFFLCSFVYIFAYFRKYHLPFRMPMSSGMQDNNDPIPGTQKARKAGGISFFGNEIKSGDELWFTNDDLRTHVLIFGSTGSGKTEALVSIAYNSLVQGSGFIYIDGKGDNSLFAKVFSMVRSMGREDDLLLINFMTGARDVLGPQNNRLSNTMNPFASGSSSMISQMVVSLMGDSKNSQSGDMWKGRAINFVESLMKVMVPMRDAGHILLDANSIREFFILEKLEEIVVDKVFPLSDGTKVPLKDFPPQIIEGLNNYIWNLPGYTTANKGNQESGVREQHGFITMQLTRVFSSLADTYGHIIRTNLAEVDIKDVVLNRRILVVLLPALEKSPDELSNLGKIIIAALKAMMAAGLGDAVEGDYRDVILRKPTNSPTPYVCIMDEYGYYAVPGFAVVPAQARSLGFSAIFAGQDLPAFQKASKEEAASICANTNVKICMKLEDPQETWEFFNKVAGETYVTNVSNFQMQANSLSINYLDSRSASVDRRARIELQDLKDQREGEAHIFFKSHIVRASMFYANPAPVKKLQINHCLKVAIPDTQDLLNLNNRLEQFAKVFSNETVEVPATISSEDEIITVLSSALENITEGKPFERGVAGLISILEYEIAKQKELSAPYEDDSPRSNISIFTKVPLPDLVKEMVSADQQDLFSLPLLRMGSTLEELKHIERITGKTAEEAETIARGLVADIENATSFPPEVLFAKDVAKTGQDIDDLIKMLGGDPDDVSEAALLDSSSKGDLDFGGGSLDLDALDLPDIFDNFKDDIEDNEQESHEDEEENNNADTDPIDTELDLLDDLSDLPELEDIEEILNSDEEEEKD